jgi:serine phosphatase RsbU (regulator of sigma subunit)/anti-sigma regulatory factor (Ser/Thr protein kinase)
LTTDPVSLLRRVELFASLPEDELSVLAHTLPRRTFADGDILVRQGEHGDRFYVVLDGTVAVVRALGEPTERQVDIVGAADAVGEFSLLYPDALRTASAVARGPVDALEMSRGAFEALLNRQPTLAWQMVRVIGSRLHQAHNAALQELREAHEQVVEKKKLERELEVAREIQRSMVPQKLPDFEGYAFGALLNPMQQVGGDFFDVIPLPDGCIGLAIGDVSGHGVPAALVMALSVALLRAEAAHGRSPAAVLQDVNRQLTALSGGNTFVTAIYGILDTNAHTFTFARSGHDAPLVMRPASPPESVESPHGVVLGLWPQIPASDVTVHLQSSAALLLYTDGVVEAFDPQRSHFGQPALERVVAEAGDLSPQDLCERIVQAVARHVSAETQHDDITLLALRRNSAPVIPPLAPLPLEKGELRLTLTPSTLAEVRRFVRTQAAAAQLVEVAVDRLVLAADEAATNIWMHGYGGVAGSLTLRTSVDDDAFTLTLVDDAPPFDPTAAQLPDTSVRLADRRLGGMGMRLMRASCDTIAWRSTEEGRNELTLRVERGGGPS